MLASEFGFIHEPFKLTPDQKFLYTSPHQLENYSRLFSGIHARKGLFLLTGESGTGKTLLLRRMVDDLTASGCRVFFFCNPVSSFNELLDDCCEQVGLNDRSPGSMQRGPAFTEYIANREEIAVLLLDEAHALPDTAIENLVQFSSVAKHGTRLFQILLSGQPSLMSKLKSLGLKSAAAEHAELRPLSDREVGPFIYHQLRTAGCDDSQLFSAEAVVRVAHYSKGFPGRINALCSNALLIASLESQSCVSAEMIDQAAEDRDIDPSTTEQTGAFDPGEDELNSEGLELPERVQAPLKDNREFDEVSPKALATTPSPASTTSSAEVMEDPIAVAGPAAGSSIRRRRDRLGFGIGLGLLVAGSAALYVINPPYEPVTKARNAVDVLIRLGIDAVSFGSAENQAPEINTGTRATHPVRIAARAQEAPLPHSPAEGNLTPPTTPDMQMHPAQAPAIATKPMPEPDPRPEVSRNSAGSADPDPQVAIPELPPGDAVVRAPVPPPVAPPTVTTPTLTVRDASGSEDTPIPLDIKVQTPGDAATLIITMRGVPSGATLSAGERITDGWRLSPSDLEGISVAPPPNSDKDFELSLQLEDTATNTAIEHRTLRVSLNAVADPPSLHAIGAIGDQFTAMPLQIKSRLTDRDGSESMVIELSGLPHSAILSAGKREADGTWVLTAPELSGLVLTPQEDSPSRVVLKITAIAVESSNNATATTEATVHLGIVAASPEPALSYSRDRQPVGAARRDPIPQSDSTRHRSRPEVLSRAELVARGEKLIELGNFEGARYYFKRAAQSGDARAATALGKTYDPVFRTTHGLVGSQPDAALALDWYTRAADAGDAEARMRENVLRNWLAQ